MKARQWYRFENHASDPSVAELFIYDDIGKSYWNEDAVTAKKLIDDLKQLPAATMKVSARVNSLGGDVFEAVAIANALRQWAVNGRTVETSVDGIAASAASIVIMAGSTIKIADNAMVMIHEPWSFEIGNSADFRKMADTLDSIRGSIVATYKWHSELSDDAIVALMQAETWFDADGAIENGFATEKVQGMSVAASISPASVAKLKVPEQFKARVEALVKPTEAPPAQAAATDVLARVSAAGLDLAFASSLVSASLTLDQVNARIEAAKAEKTQRESREAEVRALCAHAKAPADVTDKFIADGVSVVAVKAALTWATAKRDNFEIDTGLKPDHSNAGGGRVINRQSIYANFNKTPAHRTGG